MDSSQHEPNERSPLLHVAFRNLRDSISHAESQSYMSSGLISKEEEALGETAVGEILPYTPYSSVREA